MTNKKRNWGSQVPQTITEMWQDMDEQGIGFIGTMAHNQNQEYIDDSWIRADGTHVNDQPRIRLDRNKQVSAIEVQQRYLSSKSLQMKSYTNVSVSHGKVNKSWRGKYTIDFVFVSPHGINRRNGDEFAEAMGGTRIKMVDERTIRIY